MFKFIKHSFEMLELVEQKAEEVLKLLSVSDDDGLKSKL